jgi:hypothetical protein
MDQSPVIDAPALTQDESCDVVVVGAGMPAFPPLMSWRAWAGRWW